jgi:LDH2 family malate/lactate/ureidoglycolate dehydrogenase
MRHAARVGAKIAPGWIARLDGTPVMEEVDVPDEFYLLPTGGTRELGSHKGYGLGAVVDILSSTLGGIGPGFVANTPGYHLMAYRIDAFVDVAQFKRDMDTFLRGLAETKPASGHERVVYAGLLEAEETERRRAEGIPYHSEVIGWFRQIEHELGLDFAFT